ncbi:hypothetical protein LJR029_005849 [Caballeronia sp. LjRoot29]|uniref:hypothetical protein n=1 Tax=Caballeronia sp. LjRoot29 TaxID=3342315 RepID=UPI003ECD9A4D
MPYKRLLCFAMVLAIGFATACYIYQVGHPPCCDSLSYTVMSKVYADSGLGNTPFSELRTYGYPAFLALFQHLSINLGVNFNLLIFVAQFLLYIAFAALLSRLVYVDVSHRIGALLMLGLTLNLLIYPSLSIVLTDGFSVIVLLAMVAVATTVLLRGEHMRWRALVLHSLLIGLLAGFSTIVRPASIHFLGFVLPALAYISFNLRNARAFKVTTIFVLFLVGFLISVAPQVALNWHTFHKATFFPSVDLQRIQLTFGQRYLKYGTFMIQGEGHPLPYMSPWASLADGTKSYFLVHPREGILTAFLHIFGALDFDYLFTYIYDTTVFYRPVLFLFSHTAIFWGLGGWLMMLSDWRSDRKIQDISKIHLIRGFFLLTSATYALSWAAVFAPSAVENRFALPMFTLLMPLAVWAICELFANRRFFWAKIGGFSLYLALAACISVWLGSLKVVL